MIKSSCKLFAIITSYVIAHILLLKYFTGILESHWNSFSSNCCICFLIPSAPEGNSFTGAYFYCKIIEISTCTTPHAEFYALMRHYSHGQNRHRFGCEIYVDNADVFNDVISFGLTTITDGSVCVFAVIKFTIAIGSLKNSSHFIISHTFKST